MRTDSAAGYRRMKSGGWPELLFMLAAGQSNTAEATEPKDGFDMDNRSRCGRGRNLERQEYGGSGTRRRDPHHRHAD